MDRVSELQQLLLDYGSGPLLSEMPRNKLEDKGIAGSTAAHRIEEIHTPLNLAYVTFTTGSSAYQNPVGVTWQELPSRTEAGRIALEKCGIQPGDQIIITYPPLVNVFSRNALVQCEVETRFIQRPSRDALLLELCRGAKCVIGESTFLRAALQDARRLGLSADLPKDLVLIAAGSPLDLELLEEASLLVGAKVHDLYGCQEFGWLILDGVPLRKDVILCSDYSDNSWQHLIVGGIPTGDMFQLGKHPLNPKGSICTNTRKRSPVELETTLLAGAVSSIDTIHRTARTILRLKARIVRISKEYRCGAAQTLLTIGTSEDAPLITLCGPEQTKLLDDLTEAQKMYQREAKVDPVWNKLC